MLNQIENKFQFPFLYHNIKRILQLAKKGENVLR